MKPLKPPSTKPRSKRADHQRRRGDRPLEGESLQKQLEHRESARTEGEKAADFLKELANLLDQGGEAWSLQVALKAALTKQENIARDTRELLPQTLGRDPKNLDPDLKQQLDDLADRQGELNDEVKDLLDQMRQTAGNLARQSESPEDAAAAKALAEAVAKAMQKNLQQDMKEAQDATQNNQLSKASNQQSDAARTMSEMLDELGKQRDALSEVLKRQMRELAQSIQTLIERERALLEQIDDLEGPQVTTLATDALNIRIATMAAQEAASAQEKTAAVAAPLGEAIDAQATGVQALRAAGKAFATAANTQAIEHLEAALALLQEAQEDGGDDADEEEQKAKRIERYAALATRQEKLLAEVAALTAKEALDRRDRLTLRKMQPEQAAIREEAAALGEEAKDTTFVLPHRQIDSAASRAADALGRSEATPVVVADARQAAVLLRSAADALKQSKRDAEFDRPQGDPQDPEGGGGGGESDAIPPAAEVKLLKEMQTLLYDRTRALHAEVGPSARPTPVQEAHLRTLSGEQRELHEAGTRLIQKLKPAESPDPAPGAIE